MSSANQLLAAAGYGQLAGNELFFPPSANVGVLDNFYERGFVPDISTTRYFQNQTPVYGRELRFVREPQIKVRKYQKNARIKHEEFDARPLSVMIGEQADWSYKLADFDWEHMANRDFYMNSIEKGAAREIHALIGKEMIAEIIHSVSAENQGANAGYKTGRYNFGTLVTPKAVNVNNIGRVYSQVNAVMGERGLTREALGDVFGDRHLTFMVNTTFEEILSHSTYSDKLNTASCNPACNLLIEGTMPDLIYGNRTIVTNHLPEIEDVNGNPVDYIVALAKGATGFGGLNSKMRTDDGAPDGWEMIVQGLFTYGFEVFYPEAISVMIVNYE